jgi:hypothetical protein
MKIDRNLFFSALDLAAGYAILTMNFSFHNTSLLLRFIIVFIVYIQCFIGFLFLLKGTKNAIKYFVDEKELPSCIYYDKEEIQQLSKSIQEVVFN